MEVRPERVGEIVRELIAHFDGQLNLLPVEQRPPEQFAQAVAVAVLDQIRKRRLDTSQQVAIDRAAQAVAQALSPDQPTPTAPKPGPAQRPRRRVR